MSGGMKNIIKYVTCGNTDLLWKEMPRYPDSTDTGMIVMVNIILQGNISIIHKNRTKLRIFTMLVSNQWGKDKIKEAKGIAYGSQTTL